MIFLGSSGFRPAARSPRVPDKETIKPECRYQLQLFYILVEYREMKLALSTGVYS